MPPEPLIDLTPEQQKLAQMMLAHSRLTPEQKAAYRMLIYRAQIDIRNLCQSRGHPSRNPLRWWRQYRRSRLAGALADWLHNLALFSALDFEGFSEDWFWRETDLFERRWKRGLFRGWDHLWCLGALDECRALRGSGERAGQP